MVGVFVDGGGEMREIPILFSTPMVQAILDGRKTMTRRIIKPQPLWVAEPSIPFKTEDADPKGIIKCPYGEPGDRLWVRETWADNIPGCPNGITYRADHIDPKGDGPANPIKWKPSIYMPKEIARIWLEVTNVRVERLQEITEEDARREGFEPIPCDCSNRGAFGCTDCMNTGVTEPAMLEFIDTWDSIYSKRGYGWDTNPWVWVIEFKAVE